MLHPQLPLSQSQTAQRFPVEQGLCLPMDLSSAMCAMIPTKPAKDTANYVAAKPEIPIFASSLLHAFCWEIVCSLFFVEYFNP